MMKRLIASACLALTFAFGLYPSGQAQRRNDSKDGKPKPANHPPKINSFNPSEATVAIPCPGWNAPNLSCTPSATNTVTLTTDADDEDGDSLKYEYSVTEGQITGEGSSVEWDFYKLAPGSYTVKVVVSDQHGGATSASINLKIIPCPICDPSCPTMSITCPSEAEEGEKITFSISISGGDPNMNLTTNWTVSAGTIVKGQGTPTIEVDTNGADEKQITATIEVGGMPPECDRTRSCTVQIHKKAGKEEQ